jgi:hypothetical protein
MELLACVSSKPWCGSNHSSLNCYTPLKMLQGTGVRTFQRIRCQIVIVNPPPSTWGLVLYICWDIHPLTAQPQRKSRVNISIERLICAACSLEVALRRFLAGW